MTTWRSTLPRHRHRHARDSCCNRLWNRYTSSTGAFSSETGPPALGCPFPRKKQRSRQQWLCNIVLESNRLSPPDHRLAFHNTPCRLLPRRSITLRARQHDHWLDRVYHASCMFRLPFQCKYCDPLRLFRNRFEYPAQLLLAATVTYRVIALANAIQATSTYGNSTARPTSTARPNGRPQACTRNREDIPDSSRFRVPNNRAQQLPTVPRACVMTRIGSSAARVHVIPPMKMRHGGARRLPRPRALFPNHCGNLSHCWTIITAQRDKVWSMIPMNSFQR
jgi:hypothetical protein